MSGDIRLMVLILWPLVGALIGYAIGKKNKVGRDYFADFVVIAELLLVVAMFSLVRMSDTPEFMIKGFCGLDFHIMLDGFREVYGTIAAFIWMMTTLISREYFHHYHHRNRYYAFVLPALGVTLGIFFSANLFTTYLFYVLLSFTVFVGVAHDERDTAIAAASTYIAVEMVGGCIVMIGLTRLYALFGTLEIAELKECVEAMADKTPAYIAGALLFFGFGAKAGMFPLHFWMPRAHSGSPAPISTLLSSIITKTGLYGVIIVCGNIFFENRTWGLFILFLGVFTMLLGAVRALFDVHMKRILAFSSLSQIGFILTGLGAYLYLGEEGTLAAMGAILHMVNHSFLKLVLYLCAAVIYMKMHKLDLDDIRGYGHGKPLLHAAYLMGAFGLAGIPLWNGYVSKTLLHESLVEATHLAAETGGPAALIKIFEILFLIAGGMTFAYMTKLYICIFHEKHPTDQEKHNEKNGHYMSTLTMSAVIGAMIVPPVLGFVPHMFLDKIAAASISILHAEPLAHEIHYFSLENLKGSAISIAIGLILYFGVVRKFLMKKGEDGVNHYVYLYPQWLDLEYLLYRPLIFIIIPHVCAVICRMLDTPVFMKVVHDAYIEPRWVKKQQERVEKSRADRKEKDRRKRSGDNNKYR